jgi:hypothetical protein
MQIHYHHWNQESSPAEAIQFATQIGKTIRTAAKGRYKPVSKRKTPVPVTVPQMTDEMKHRGYKPIELPPLDPLPINPPSLSEFIYTERITEERLNLMLSNIPEGFLSETERDLIVYIVGKYQEAISFTDMERGRFKQKYYPDYIMETVPHTPWRIHPGKIPESIRPQVIQLLRDQVKAGNLEPSISSYRSKIFAIVKPSGGLRIVHDLQPLNAVSVQDSMLPPNVAEFAESFVGRAVYGVMDLYSGYHQRTLHEQSRPLTACQTDNGNMQLTSLPIGYTNSMQEYQRTTSHAIAHLSPEEADAFVDDIGIKGPRSRYNDEPIPENLNIRKYIWEYAHTLQKMFATFIEVGCTAAGKKLVLATPIVHIVGNLCSLEGRRPHHGIITKVLNWPIPRNPTEVRGFLGTAGVARNWIKGFAGLAKPLTQLTRKQQTEFIWTDEAQNAMDQLKKSVTSIPALKTLDYNLAQQVDPDPDKRTSNLGLIVLSVDSSIIATGYVLSQYFKDGKHPILFGSITWNEVESRYSQPKIELYGLFRALKALRYQLWGLPFQVEADASFLKQMINSPDLPNSAMTRWVSYIQLFNFNFKHVPGTQHRAADGLSRRPQAEEDTDNSSDEDLEPGEGGHFLKGMKPADLGKIPIQLDIENQKLVERLQELEKDTQVAYSSATKLQQRFTSSASESSYDTEEQEKIPTLTKGGRFAEKFSHQNNTNTKIYTNDGPEYWQRITHYLNTLKVPKEVTNRKSFIQTTRKYFLYRDKLWRRSRGLARIVVQDTETRQKLLKGAHDESGHRGRDPTYKKLSDSYFWPNMMSDTALFCRTCLECQARSSYRPKVQLHPSFVPTVMRKVGIDIVDMGITSDGYKYIVDVRDDLTGWLEAKMLYRKSSKEVADFFYQDVICRFGCIPQVSCDNGTEFEGAFEILTREHGIPLVKTSPYHPEANGAVERGHRTWINSIWKLCGKKKKRWARYFYAALWADRVTVKRTTGFSPYFLTYGKPHIFPFHISDPSWYELDWGRIESTVDLLALRAKQLHFLKLDRDSAAESVKKARIQAAEDYARRYQRLLKPGYYQPGEMVLVLHARDEVGQGKNKVKHRDKWGGPYRIVKRHQSGAFELEELDRTHIKGTVPASHLRPFFTRNQLKYHTGQVGKPVLGTQDQRRELMSEDSDDFNLNEFGGSDFIDSESDD